MDELSSFLEDTTTFLRRHFAALCLIILPIVVPLNIFCSLVDYFWAKDGEFWPTAALQILAIPFCEAAIIFYISGAVISQSVSREQCYQQALKLFWPFFLLYILTTLAICTGALLLILPGLIVFARMAFSPFYCLLDRETPTNSFRLSWEHTRDYQWLILAGSVIIWLVTLIPVWLVELIITHLDAWNPVFTVVSESISSILAIPLTIFGFRVFTAYKERLKREVSGSA